MKSSRSWNSGSIKVTVLQMKRFKERVHRKDLPKPFVIMGFGFRSLLITDITCCLAEKVASVIGCIVISMENYRTGVRNGNDLELIDFCLLIQNLEINLLKNPTTKDVVML
ncbi:unnamed protein product [Fraxinus pennsylvanica]|uniref:Uncharacterized protein n=1 Tax=Fraxinus pennsylvanica TaxID=56036 RepID=A0AAD2E5M9_9LAMI|nr:unnamed protein product [Fraxinus pennsylvanica]